MITFLQAIILGVVQGITEFLPISSDGHLALLQYFFNFKASNLAYDVLLHFATLLVIVIYFRNNLWEILAKFFLFLKSKKQEDFPMIIFFLALATIPIALVGFLVKDYIDVIFANPKITGAGFLFTAVFMFLAQSQKQTTKTLKSLNFKDSLWIGFVQTLALLPGVSRSGSTIFAGLSRKFNHTDVFNFSFLLAIPAILGAQILYIPEILQTPTAELPQYLVGFLVAFITGFFALSILKNFVVGRKLHYFGIYCLVLGVITLVLIK